MIWKLDPLWLMMAVATVSVLGYFLGNALDAVMRHDGFGAFGNMALFVAGFFGAIYLANTQGFVLHGLAHAATIGLGGAFVLIAFLAGCKAAISRLPR